MNWGTKIILGMASFMLFIIGMVAYMFSVHGRDALVEENYYENGIHYDADYNAQENVIRENAQPKITVTKSQIVIALKQASTYDLVLMRPSNQLDDVKMKGNTAGDANLIVVDKTKMATGMWLLNLRWQAGNKTYLIKKNITL